VLLLLPPSEGKTPPAGPPVELDELAFAKTLGRTRRKVLAAVRGGRALRAAPAGPAAEVYSGVLFSRLGLADLPASAADRVAEDLLIASGLWGLLRPSDRIPHYKLPVGTSLPRLGRGLAATWRPAIEATLSPRDVEGELVIDIRSGPYAAIWQPRLAQHLVVRSFRVNADGSRQVISHNAKVARGDVARAVLRAGRVPQTPDDVAEIASAAGLRVEIGGGPSVALDVLE
jgi:cytoplasmic iron level regulating protein YaaA (DUF328/UPF0246 family)